MGENHTGNNAIVKNGLESPTASQGLDQSGSPNSGASFNNNVQQYSAEYLAQLLKDKKQLAAFPNVFIHLERLIDEEINKVRVSLFQFEFTTGKEALTLPDADGTVQTMQERVYVPIKDYPDYNFVGRILGPRGMTAKQLEQETGCKIMVRGRGSMRDKKKEEMNRGKPNWEHLNDELHVLIQCEDTENRAQLKLKRAIDEVKKLLVPAPEGEDELKRKQLMELAIINGTYRPANQSKIALNYYNNMDQPRLLTPMTLQSPMRSPSLGAPIILSPSRAQMAGQPNCSQGNGLMAAAQGNFHPGLLGSPTTDALTAAAVAQGFFLNNFSSFADPATLAAYHPYAALTSPLFAGDYPGLDFAQAGQLLARH